MGKNHLLSLFWTASMSNLKYKLIANFCFQWKFLWKELFKLSFSSFVDELLSEPSKCDVTLLWYITRKVSAQGWETERIIHGCLDMWDSSLCGQLPCCAPLCDIKLNIRREIPDLRAAMYYFVYYMNILLTRKSWLHSRLRKNHSCRRNRVWVMCPWLISNIKHLWKI